MSKRARRSHATYPFVALNAEGPNFVDRKLEAFCGVAVPTGHGLVLLDALVPAVLEWGIQEAEFSWILESNSLSRGSLERGGAIRSKTWRMYQDDRPA